jgi:hypothetical protein
MSRFLWVIVFVVIFVAVAIFSLGLTIDAHAAGVPDSVVIKVIQSKQPPVNFSHKAHLKLGIKCTDCHTKASGGPLKPELIDAKQKGKVANAFHTQCLDCHKKKKAADPASKAPTGCKDCHRK